MPPKAKFTKEQIIAAAVELVEEEGMSALTARSLCKRLDCSVCPIFTVFKNMEDVRDGVIAAIKMTYSDYVRAGLQDKISFKGVGTAYIRFAMEKPNFFRFLFMSRLSVERLGALLPELDENYDAILNSVKSGYGLSDAVAEQLYRHLFVYTHGIATLIATGVYKFTAAEISAMMTEVFLGLLKNLEAL